MRSITILIFLILLSACGGPYYAQGPVVQPVYEPGMTVVYVGGVQGYYDGYHVFRPLVVVNGFSGYYRTDGVFISNNPEIRYSRKPFYSGPSTASRGGASYARPGRPEYGGGGAVTRGNGAPPPAMGSPSGKPDYGSGGAVTRGGAAPSASPSMAPSSKPNYGMGGAATRGGSAPASKPNFGSGSGSSRGRGK